MGGLVCWKCGASLRKLGLPIGRFDLCPECRVDLHVCRLCRYYDERLSGDCSKEEADYVSDKEQATYCQYFKPRANAWQANARSSNAQAELEALFGGGGASEGASTQVVTPKENKQKARAELDALFGGDGDVKEEESEEDKARKALNDLFK